MVAERFHLSPRVVARELDADTENLMLECLRFLGYAEAKSAFDHAKDKERDLTAWRGSKVMANVERNTFDLHAERLKKRSG